MQLMYEVDLLRASPSQVTTSTQSDQRKISYGPKRMVNNKLTYLSGL